METSNDYYARRDKWSNSMMSSLEDNEASFDEWYKGCDAPSCEDRFANGQYLHSCLLELCRPYCAVPPKADENEYVINPKGLKLTSTKNKTIWAELTEGKDNGTYYVIKEEVADAIKNLTQRFFDEVLKDILLSSKHIVAEEVFEGDLFGLPCRAKMDLVFQDEFGRQIVIDWKGSTTYSEFKRKAKYNYSYARQSYMYTKLANAKEFSFYVFDLKDFNRYKRVDVDLNGDFFSLGERRTIDGVERALIYLSEGTSADIFKSETL